MTELVYSADRAGEAQALLTHQLLGKTVLDALIAADAQQSQEIEDAVAQLRARLDIDTQTGAQLDAIGALVGQPRQSRQDPEYRLWLKARVLVNRSSGSPKDIYAIAYILLGSNADLFLRQIPVGHVLEVGGEFPAPSVVAVQRILQEASPIAVPFYQQYALAAYDRFELASGSTPVALSDNGYDAGRMVDWIGPGQTPDPYANIARAFGRRLIDCWDCRKVEYTAGGDAVRLAGHTYELTPFDADAPPTQGAENVRGIAPISMTSQRMLQTARHTSIFGGTQQWSIAMHLTMGADADARVFEVAADPTIESGAGAHNVTVVASTSGVFLRLEEEGTVAVFTFGAVSIGTSATIVITYDGAGTAQGWVNGAKTVDTDTHVSVTSLAALTWGEYDAGDDSVPWGAYKLAVFDRVLTDAEAGHLSDILTLEFTDDAYY